MGIRADKARIRAGEQSTGFYWMNLAAAAFCALKYLLLGGHWTLWTLVAFICIINGLALSVRSEIKFAEQADRWDEEAKLNEERRRAERWGRKLDGERSEN